MSGSEIASGAACRTRIAVRAHLGATAVLLLIHFIAAAQLWRVHSSPPSVFPQDARLLLDPNTATRDDLMLLPGIGPELSKRIVSHRQSIAGGGPFASIDELDAVRGIGPITVDRLRPHLRIELEASDIPASAP